jgi:hypothetical protein
VFKQCALAMLVPFLVMIPLALLLGFIGPYLIRQLERPRPPATSATTLPHAR